MTASLALVLAEVRRWQTGDGSPDAVAKLALDLSAGDETAAHALMADAVAVWETVTTSARQPYRDRNGSPIVRTAA